MSNPFETFNIINIPTALSWPPSADGQNLWVAKELYTNTEMNNIVFKIPYSNPENFSQIFIQNFSALRGIASNGTYVGVIGYGSYNYAGIFKCNDPTNNQIIVTVPHICNAITLDENYLWCSTLIDGYPSSGISNIYQISFDGILLQTIVLPNYSNILQLSSDGLNLWAATAGQSDHPCHTITKILCANPSPYNIQTIDLGINNLCPWSISSDGTNVWVAIGVYNYDYTLPKRVIKISCATLNTSEISLSDKIPISVSSNGDYVFVACLGTSSIFDGVLTIDCSTSNILAPTLSQNLPLSVYSVSYKGNFAWGSDFGNNTTQTLIYQYGIPSYLPQLEDPYNLNYVAKGVKPNANGQWTKVITTTYNPLNQNWSSVVTSSDGKFVLACINGGKIYSSSNYGYDLQPETSSILPSSASWSCIKISPDGSKAVACINNTSSNGGVYTASLNGTNWIWNKTTLQSTNWSSVSFSGDSLNIAAVQALPSPIVDTEIYIGSYDINTTSWNWVTTFQTTANWSSITYLGNSKKFCSMYTCK